MSGDWNTALHAYATAQRAAGRSPGTVRLHRHYLQRLAWQHRTPYGVTRQQLERFLAEERWAPETRKSARAAVRGFYRWAHGNELLDDDPAHALSPVRVPQGVARPAPEHLVRRLIREDGRLGLMAMLAAYCGLRRSEIALLHSRDLVGDELVIIGKGGRQRAVPVVSAALLFQLRQVDGWVFPNGTGSHLSPGHVGRLLSEAMPVGWTAHTLRHRMASTAYAATRDLLAVGAVLGHSRPETTQRYVRMPDDALRDAVRAASIVA